MWLIELEASRRLSIKLLVVFEKEYSHFLGQLLDVLGEILGVA